MDDFVLAFSQGLNPKDFISKDESVSRSRKGKRQYLKDSETRCMMRGLDDHFTSFVDVPNVRHGKRQRIETLINEEALLLARYLRGELETWIPSAREATCERARPPFRCLGKSKTEALA